MNSGEASSLPPISARSILVSGTYAPIARIPSCFISHRKIKVPIEVSSRYKPGLEEVAGGRPSVADQE